MPSKCDQPGQKGTDLRLVQIYSQLAVENLTILTRDLEFCLAINKIDLMATELDSFRSSTSLKFTRHVNIESGQGGCRCANPICLLRLV
jgi:hypothetical protein